MSITTPEITSEVTSIAEAARAVVVKTSSDYEAAGGRLQLIKGLMAKIASTFDPHIKRAHEAHKALLREKADAEAPLAAAERVYKGAMLTFQQDQEAERRRLEAIAQEAARKERERLETLAAKADDKGKTERADALRNQAAAVPTPVVRVETPKVSGISTRTVWRAEVTDKRKLIAAVAAGTVPQSALDVNMAFLNQQARSLKSEFAYPGVEAVEDQQIASRSA